MKHISYRPYINFVKVHLIAIWLDELILPHKWVESNESI